MTDIDAPLVKQVFDISKRKRKTHIHHHCQTDDFGRGFETAKRGAFFIPKRYETGLHCSSQFPVTLPEEGLGRFLRSLTGLDRAAAKEAFSGFTASSPLTADQLEFLDRIIDALTETGLVDPKNFYESPYTDIDSQGIVGVLPKEQAKQIIEIVRGLNIVEAA